VFEQLADSSPTAFADPRLRSAAASTLSALAHSRLPELQQMLEILEGQLGSAGPDVLFHVVQFHGGSKARALALASLAKPRVKALSSPELQAAMTLQAAGCKAGADTLREAVAQGDARALLVLKALRTTCAPAHERDAAFRKLEARLTKR
jgi:hypothetical protein